MTASDSSAGDGFEFDGSTETGESGGAEGSAAGSAFADWAREDLGVRLVGQVEEQERIARSIRDGLAEGEDVSGEVARYRRAETERLARLLGAAVMASDTSVRNRATLGKSMENAGEAVESRASAVGQLLAEGEDVDRDDLRDLRAWAFEVVQLTDRAMAACQKVER
jgi:hypothetical protein